MNLSGNSLCDQMFESLIPTALKDVTQQCLNIIDSASQSQIESAVNHNRYEINKLLVKLLTINLVSNEKELFSSKIDKSNTLNVCAVFVLRLLFFLLLFPKWRIV